MTNVALYEEQQWTVLCAFLWEACYAGYELFISISGYLIQDDSVINTASH